ncbi:hypothetical protein AJ80_00066 [Polytolypa hystricis UAMH7299]|uniref:BZIP domain-containing protein n=1 Tax=Polytolypa hystricis (strain UAMH7299) TaxID=1447883 RepID=A0A2B7Z2N2_POLH7|nr:hypothetical protein AJ80_00066 [Polytolypa hystricis UAMH7299]
MSLPAQQPTAGGPATITTTTTNNNAEDAPAITNTDSGSDNTNNNSNDNDNNAIISDRLARKRARDRKSQRAMRDRVRWFIDELQQRVAHLSEALEAERTAHAALRANVGRDMEMLRSENRVLRERLEGTPNVHPSTESGFQTAATSNAYGAWNNDGMEAMMDVKRDAGFGASSTAGVATLLPVASGDTAAAAAATGMGFTAPAGTVQELSPWNTNPPPPTALVALVRPPQAPPHIAVPWNTEPSCLADRIVQDYIEARRATFSNSPDITSLPPEQQQLNVSAILEPENKQRETRSVHEISTVVSDLLLSYHEIDTPPKKVSCLYSIYKLLNWLIYRTPETFAQLPGFLRPHPIQLSVRHAAWIDRVPWPEARAYLIEHPEVNFDEFASVYSSWFDISWPYSPSHIVVSKSTSASRIPTSTLPQHYLPAPSSPVMDHNSGMSLNPVYEQHIRQLKNWTVGEKFRRKLPELARIIDQDRLKDYGP